MEVLLYILIGVLIGMLVVILWAFFRKTPTLTEEQLDDWSDGIALLDAQDNPQPSPDIPFAPDHRTSPTPIDERILSTSNEKGGSHSTDPNGKELTIDELREYLKDLQKTFNKLLSSSQSLDNAPRVNPVEAKLELVKKLLVHISTRTV